MLASRAPRTSGSPSPTGQGPFIPGLLVLETNALLMKGRITEAMAVADTATDAACLTGNDQLTVWALWADAMACSVAGDTARALASAREAVARSERRDRDILLEPVAAASRRGAERGRGRRRPPAPS